ncbi:DNA polymerase Y family protein [Microbacterium sp. YY-03]|uniref:DNA polymerase Y family protein n=1 Tax=Microbacterium sp. YY-03 TaxID=3421636 RepID=UPI003D174BC9
MTTLTAPSPLRTIALWFPDWPVTARALTTPTGWVADAPVAVTHGNTIVACSAAARTAGVRRGQRRRDAQAACSDLRLMPHDPNRDARAFSPVVSRIEAQAPGVHIVRPGLCVLRSRGPSRYYGGEREAARVLIDAAREHGIDTVHVGVADGPFTAEQAARTALVDASEHRIRIVAVGEAAAFLAPLPVAILDDPNIASLLSRLGVHTLGQFAALDEALVRDRLSERGAQLQSLAGGRDSREITPRVPPPELAREIAFEPPLEIAEQVAFAVRQTADEVIAAVAAAALVCTEIRVEFTDDRGIMTDRVWLHPTCFDAAALVDRVRWQLQAAWEKPDEAVQSPVAKVRLVPEAVDAAMHHQPALVGRGPDARVHHALSRVQAILGHRGVVTAEVTGGRLLGDRQHLVPWGDRVVTTAVRDRPWPGHLEPPLPTTLAPHDEIDVLTAMGERVHVTERGDTAGTPEYFVVGRQRLRISSWAGPWPIAERFWLNQQPRYRFQVVDEQSRAWVVLYENDEWQAEGRYD